MVKITEGFMNALGFLCIAGCIVFTGIQNVAQKEYCNRLAGRGSLVFCAISSFVCMLFFLVKALITDGLHFAPEVLPYILLYGVGYCFASLCYLLAMENGPLSLTSLVLSFSLVIPTLYGIIVDNDPVGIKFYIGVTLLVVSILLINSRSEDMKISLKWVIFSLLTFFGNGLCGTVQTEQSNIYGSYYDDVFMILSLAIVVVTMTTIAFLYEKKDIKDAVVRGIPLISARGLSNAICNLTIMVAAAVGVGKSIMFPLISGGGIVVAWAISLLIYREKLSKSQNIAMVLGLVSIVLLSL